MVTEVADMNDFWEYNPTNNAWTQKANFGGGVRIYAVGFSIGTKGYIGTGPNINVVYNDFWEYDPFQILGYRKADFGGSARSIAVGFSIGNKGYLGTGEDTSFIYTHNYKNDFWEYDPGISIGPKKANFGGSARDYAIGLSIDTKGYIGTGYDISYNMKNDFWEYDPSSNSWTQKANFGESAREFAVGFSIGNQGYIGTGVDYYGIYYNDFWEYFPSCILPNAPTNTTPPVNQNICIGNSTTLSASGIGTLGWYSAATGGTWLGGGTNYITPILTTNTTYYVQDSTCAASLTRTSITVTVNPPPVPTITGQNSMCVNSGNYNYSTETGMLNYVWTVSSGGVINYGLSSNQIQVSWISGGTQTVSVTYSNGAGCTAITPTVLNVTVNPLPGQSGTITGTENVCAGANGINYFVAPIPNTTFYVWTLPPDAFVASGTGTNSITVNFDTNATSGNMLVYGNNLCGNGNVSPNLAVTVNPMPPAPVITNAGDTLQSNAPFGNQWYYQGILLVGDTSQIYVANYNGYYWDVVTVNGCSSDTSNHKLIVITGISSFPSASIKVYPVPNDGQFNVNIVTSSKESFSIYVYNSLGIEIFEVSELDVNGSLQKVIDLRQLPEGIYDVILESTMNRIVKKIVVRK